MPQYSNDSPKITVFWDVTSCFMIDVTDVWRNILPPFPSLKMQAAYSSEVSVNIYRTTQLNVAELIVHSHHYENVISYETMHYPAL
jgi:hypothetical protein